jgi:hypothetical protein
MADAELTFVSAEGSGAAEKDLGVFAASSVIARSEATKQSRAEKKDWIASLRSQ